MDSQAILKTDEIVKISDDVIDKLLEPIPNEKIIEKVAQINGWKQKRPTFQNGQSKREYFTQHTKQKLNMKVLREFRTIREHFSINKFKWLIFSWDKSIARYYPDKIKEKIESLVKNKDSLVNLDILSVHEETKTVFLLLEQWKKEIVADTLLSRIETKIPKYFRAYLTIDKKMLLVQDRSEQATKEFIALLEKAFSVQISEVRVNAMLIREFVRNNPVELTKLIVKVPQEVSGFSGLTELTVEGSDVIKGSKGLMDRHETSPIMVGPWVGVSNKDIELYVGKALKASSISNVLDLYTIIFDIL